MTEPVRDERDDTDGTDDTDTDTDSVAGVDLKDALGGKLGVAESGLPSAVFIVVYTVNGQVLAPALWAALATAAVMTVVRILKRESLKYALGGMFAVALSAFIASRTGNAANFYLPGLIWQGGYAIVYLVSIVVGWPLIGVILGPLLGEGFTWRDDPARRRAYTQVTWFWFAMFAVRFGVQLPLYLLGMTVALGWVKLAMGWPVFALVAWLSYLVLTKAPPASPRPAKRDPDADELPDVTGEGAG